MGNNADNISIGIIGGTGGIGKWFAHFFQNAGYPVHVSGRTSGMRPQEMAETCSVVIIAVPIRNTIDTIEKVGPLIKPGNLLMDFTSLKTAAVSAMLRASHSEVIGMHPLFGPELTSIAGQNVILCPARGEQWLPWLAGTLEQHGAVVTISTPERHDEMMSLVQALNHLNTITLGVALDKSGIKLSDLDPFSTPIFRTKRNLIERIFSGNPRLYAEIIAFNPDRDRILELYSRSLTEIKELLEKSDTEGLAKAIQHDNAREKGN